ncbi:DUF982 domain-containing protein [Mesorhizobium xinjiangense]|uniref:DUF982 domain-containing protein n=1 Tax=Mesorhizobium xinjiangense TaxID=2678685 RepID=UPI0012EDE362|nr:DUF982 domain-containing protein [Mesorhizobium xinjiangense]
MNVVWFSKPVPISEGIIGDIRYVSNAQQAIEALNSNWREQGSAKFHAAVLACQRSISGAVSPEAARSAFVEAASEARVLFE